MQYRQPVFAALWLASGAALLVYLFSGISLGLGLIVGGALLVSAGAAIWVRSETEQRSSFRRRLTIGLLSGLTATIVYDVSRLALYYGFNLQVSPFKAFPAFGAAILGSDTDPGTALAAGIIYHIINGISFAMAYTLAFGTKGPLAGFIWAMVLEGLMLATYPSWLNIVHYDQFLIMSLVGHGAYGITLGISAQRWLQAEGRTAGHTART